MKGQILHLDEATGRGVITTPDGRRFAFHADQLLGDGQVARAGVAVDFQAQDDFAFDIYPDPGAPVQAWSGAQKNKVIAALLAFFLGGFGAHKFYIGANGAGVIMALCGLFGWVLLFVPTVIVWTIALIEALIYATRPDEDFYRQYELGKKAWF